MDIQRLDSAQAAARLPELAALLQDAVAGGASVGFLPPLSDAAENWCTPPTGGGGVGGALMQAVEVEAARAGRTTLVLDTRQGDPSEMLYSSLGYARAGVIPQYARSADGALHTTVFMYKLLTPG